MTDGKPHKKLMLWQKAMDLVQLVYDVTGNLPREEEFGLKSQIRRAVVSVPSNIAEGLTRQSSRDRLHFLNIGRSSLSELDTQIEISRRLSFIRDDVAKNLDSAFVEVEKLLSGVSKRLRSGSRPD